MIFRVAPSPRLAPLTLLAVCTCLSLGCSDSSAEDGSAGETSTTGDGDGDPATGDGDGDPSGDGDGDPSGDGDGDPSGDGDGDPSGDGDGDPPMPSLCEDVELPPRDGAELLVSPAGPGEVELDGQTMSLRAAVSSASEGDTILLADGTYTLPAAGPNSFTGVYITTPNITIRSQSGDPTAVIIDSGYVEHGNQSAAVTIAAPGVAIADLTVQRSIFHLIHFWTDGDDALIHNVHLIDGGQQFIKASSGDGIIDGVEVSCSSFVMTDAGRENVWGYGPQNGGTTCYTGGIDTHESTNWHVHDSYFEGIYCDAETQHPAHGQASETYTGGLSEHAIHMWDSEAGSGHLIERNRIVNCARGIGIGLVADVYGTRVLNNMVYSEHAGSGEHDVGIIVERAIDTLVAHNTVYFSHPEAYASGIEYRWGSTSNLTVHGNLSNRMIRARDGASAELVDNLGEAADAGEWFVAPADGDLHLSDCSAPGEAVAHGEVTVDIDGDPRPDPSTRGADICP